MAVAPGAAKWVLTNQATLLHSFAADGQHLLTQDETHLRLWRMEDDQLKASVAIPNGGGFTDAVVSPDGRLLAAFKLGDITIWSLPSATLVGVLKGHTRKGAHLAMSPDGRTLASVCDGGAAGRKSETDQIFVPFVPPFDIPGFDEMYRWLLGESQSQPILAFGGGGVGSPFGTLIFRFPQNRLTVIVLENQYLDQISFCGLIADELLGKSSGGSQ